MSNRNQFYGLSTLVFLLSLGIVIVLTVIPSCSSPQSSNSVDKEGYRLIFDGKTLYGWKYDPAYWRVENGVLVGEITASTILKRNSFIIKEDLVTRDDRDVEARFDRLPRQRANHIVGLESIEG